MSSYTPAGGPRLAEFLDGLPILTRWLEGREAQVAKFLELAPLGRAATPDDIADAVLYLATGTALTTGQVLVVDGGRTM